MGIVLEIDPASVEPDPVTSIQLYRIAQEAVHNAVKHSEASTVSVALKGLENELLLVVTDDGKGILDRNTGGMGISIMNYRADMINGDTIGVRQAGRRYDGYLQAAAPEKGQKMKRTIVIVDDHPIVRQGFIQLINMEDDLAVTGQAEDVPGAHREIDEKKNLTWQL